MKRFRCDAILSPTREQTKIAQAKGVINLEGLKLDLELILGDDGTIRLPAEHATMLKRDLQQKIESFSGLVAQLTAFAGKPEELPVLEKDTYEYKITRINAEDARVAAPILGYTFDPNLDYSKIWLQGPEQQIKQAYQAILEARKREADE